MTYTAPIHLDWQPFDRLPEVTQRSQLRYRPHAAQQLYAWDETARSYIFRDEGPCIVATGAQLEAVGVHGFSKAHLWVMQPSDLSKQKWTQLFELVDTGSTTSFIDTLIELRQEKKLTYQSLIDQLRDLEASADDVIRIRDRLGYRSGWEHYILEAIASNQ